MPPQQHELGAEAWTHRHQHTGAALGGCLPMVSRSTCNTDADDRLPIQRSDRHVRSSASGQRERAMMDSITFGPPGWLTQAPTSGTLRPCAPRNSVTSSPRYRSMKEGTSAQHELDTLAADVPSHRAHRVGVEVAACIQHIRAGGAVVRPAVRRRPPPPRRRRRTMHFHQCRHRRMAAGSANTVPPIPIPPPCRAPAQIVVQPRDPGRAGDTAEPEIGTRRTSGRSPAGRRSGRPRRHRVPVTVVETIRSTSSGAQPRLVERACQRSTSEFDGMLDEPSFAHRIGQGRILFQRPDEVRCSPWRSVAVESSQTVPETAVSGSAPR